MRNLPSVLVVSDTGNGKKSKDKLNWKQDQSWAISMPNWSSLLVISVVRNRMTGKKVRWKQNFKTSLRWPNTVFKSFCLIHHYFKAIYALAPVFFQESRLTTAGFILTFWLRWVLLPWQRGWLKTRLKNWFLFILKKFSR